MPKGHGEGPTSSHIGVITKLNENEGTLLYGRFGRLWQRWYPTWKEMDVGRFMRVRIVQWMDQASRVVFSKEPFMVPSGRGLNMLVGGGKRELRSLAPGVFSPVSFLCREVDFPTKVAGKWEMEGHNPLSRETSVRVETIVGAVEVMLLVVWGRKWRKFNHLEVEGRTWGKGGSIWKKRW